MENTKEQNLNIVRDGAKEMADLIGRIREVADGVKYETGYQFSYKINQEIDSGYTDNLVSNVEDVACGDRDEDILSYL